MAWSRICLLCFLVASVCSAVADGAAVETLCPAEFTDGAVNDVICVINTTELASVNCASAPSTLLFSIFSGGISYALCTTPYTTAECNASLQDGECGCTGLREDTLNFTFRYVGNRDSHERSQLDCEVCSAFPPLVKPASNCDVMVFDNPPTTTPPPGPTDVSPTTTQGTGGGDRASNACIISTVLAVVVSAIVVGQSY